MQAASPKKGCRTKLGVLHAQHVIMVLTTSPNTVILVSNTTTRLLIISCYTRTAFAETSQKLCARTADTSAANHLTY